MVDGAVGQGDTGAGDVEGQCQCAGKSGVGAQRHIELTGVRQQRDALRVRVLRPEVVRRLALARRDRSEVGAFVHEDDLVIAAGCGRDALVAHVEDDRLPLGYRCRPGDDDPVREHRQLGLGGRGRRLRMGDSGERKDGDDRDGSGETAHVRLRVRGARRPQGVLAGCGRRA